MAVIINMTLGCCPPPHPPPMYNTYLRALREIINIAYPPILGYLNCLSFLCKFIYPKIKTDVMISLSQL